ncbi:hypothetical protein HUG10_13525 [Halorarum halophilum]|uniref:Uncharacterized protein n=1 Tax=Halorarum halophilum TaxID=2743090 RepID=A0A7D5GYE6_9EURY|nr:hypothetical protein [Halobaculum halophilum]QLG28509.1 hypothetical protein HUG10_13525 [Halobaculum halophilum]
MPTPVRDGTTLLDVTREEAWVVHSALMEQLRAASERDESAVEVDALHALERPRGFTREEMRAIREALVEYLVDAPLRDRPPGRKALRAADAALN